MNGRTDIIFQYIVMNMRNIFRQSQSLQISKFKFFFIINNCLKYMERSSSKPRQKRQQMHKGHQSYKIYIKIFNQLLSQHKQTIQKYLPMRETEKDPSITLKKSYDFPNFTKNIHEIMYSYQLKKQFYQQTIEELIEHIKKLEQKANFNLNEAEAQEYRKIIEDNQKLFQQKMKKTQFQLQLTIFKMLKIDILSSFLKLNYQYRKIHKMKVSVVGNRLLNKAFDIKSDEYSLYYTQLKSHFKFIQFPYQQEFKQLILLCSIVEVKFRICNLRKRYGKITCLKLQTQIQAFVSSKLQQQQQNNDQIHQYPLQDYQYRFCQIIFVPIIRIENFQYKNQLQKAQIKLLLQNIIRITNKHQKNKQFLNIKIKYSISFQSLFRFVQNQKKIQNKDEIKQIDLKNIQKAQWAFLRGNHYRVIEILQKNLNVKLPPSTSFMNDKSLLMINLCSITMKRIALLTNANKAHYKIDIFLKRQSIYIYKLEFCYSEFSKKPEQNNEDDDEQTYTIVLATTEKDIVYAAFFKCQLNEFQFARVIKIATKQAKLNYFSIFLYLIFDLKPFEWKFIDALFTIRNYYDVRLYFSASSHPFIIHFCACHLIKILIQNQRPTSSNFMTIAESSALKVINAFSNSAKTISIFCQINKPKNRTIDQNYQEQFEQKKIQVQLRSIFKNLYSGINKHKDPQVKKIELFKNGKLYYFHNVIQQHYKVDDRQTQHYKGLSNFKPLALHEEQQFVQKLLCQMKSRHPYLTNEQKKLLSEDIYPILCNKNWQKKDFIKILTASARFLLCYQVYFNQMVNRGQLLNMPHYLGNQITFLRRVYRAEYQQITQLFPNLIPEFVKKNFCMDYLTGQKLRRDYKAYQYLSLEQIREEQADNIKNLNNPQFRYNKK